MRFSLFRSCGGRQDVENHKVEELVNAKEERRFGGIFGFWSGLAPDGSPLIVRDTGVGEIYALELGQQ